MSSAAEPQAAPEPEETTENPVRRGIFRSLAVRNYRLFAAGAAVSNTGTWMARIAQDWLVLSLTGSSFAVGVTTALQFLPMLLFGLYGGVIADRYPKRAILLATQAAMGLLALVLAALTLAGWVHVWHVYAIAFLLGVVTAVDNPTRQAFVVEMVGPGDIRNAVSLNSANFQSARLIGPAVAGVLITAVGSGWAFLCNGLSFLAPLTGLLLMRTAELHPVERAPRRRGQLREGLHYVRDHPRLLWPIVLIGFIGTFGFNFPIWLTAFAHHVFHGNAGTYGLFTTLMAAGSLAGALLAARRATTPLRLMIGAALGFGVLETAAALAPPYLAFLVLLPLIGAFGLTVNTTANAAVQLTTDPAMRGRVMSLFMMVFVGGTPLGGPLFGWLSDALGPRVSFLLGGLTAAAAAVAVGALLARSLGLRLAVGRRAARSPGQARGLIAVVPRRDPPAPDPAPAPESHLTPAPVSPVLAPGVAHSAEPELIQAPEPGASQSPEPELTQVPETGPVPAPDRAA